MKNIFKALAIAAACGVFASPVLASDLPDGAKIFKKKCTMCHKIDKKKVGPAVKAMNTDAEVLRSTVTNGRKMMPKYSRKLSSEQIDAVVAFLKAQQGNNPCAK
ncbi:MAG: cytochrome c [Mariprofundaceae bacterium]